MCSSPGVASLPIRLRIRRMISTAARGLSFTIHPKISRGLGRPWRGRGSSYAEAAQTFVEFGQAEDSGFRSARRRRNSASCSSLRRNPLRSCASMPIRISAASSCRSGGQLSRRSENLFHLFLRHVQIVARSRFRAAASILPTLPRSAPLVCVYVASRGANPGILSLTLFLGALYGVCPAHRECLCRRTRVWSRDAKSRKTSKTVRKIAEATDPAHEFCDGGRLTPPAAAAVRCCKIAASAVRTTAIAPAHPSPLDSGSIAPSRCPIGSRRPVPAGAHRHQPVSERVKVHEFH